MLKKTFSLLIATFLIFITTNVFAANNNFGQSMNNAGNGIRNVVGGAENVVEDAVGGIGAGVQNIGNALTQGDTNNDNMDNGSLENGGYTATRTATPRATSDNNAMGINSNIWTWIILGIAAVLIVGLVWYYAKQNSNGYNNHN